MPLDSWFYNGKKVTFWSVSGEVLGSSKHSETHVSSRGGGGYIHQGSGHVAAPQVTSTVITTHEFWLRQDDGTEEAIQLQNKDIPLRIGQRISVVSGQTKGKKTGFYVALKNHNARQWWEINPVDDLLKAFGFFRSWGSRVLWMAAAFFATKLALRMYVKSQYTTGCHDRILDVCRYFDVPWSASIESQLSVAAWVAAFITLVVVTVWKTIRYIAARRSLRLHIERLMRGI